LRASLTRAALAVLAVALAAPASAETVVQHERGLTITVDTTHAHPGGLLIVYVRATRRLGPTTAILNGRRALSYDTPRGRRALVGLPATTRPGPARLGVEIRGRRGRRRIGVDIRIDAWPRARRGVDIAPERRALVSSPRALHDSRRLLGLLRTSSDVAQWTGPFKPPVDVRPIPSFGLDETAPDDLPVNERLDGVYGEYHRGLDYAVPVGTLVQAPAAGTVLLADFLSVSGYTLVIDHGQGLVSLLCHLGRIDVAQDQWIEGRTPIALSGDTGVCAEPHLHWGTYVHGVAIDPEVLTGDVLR